MSTTTITVDDQLLADINHVRGEAVGVKVCLPVVTRTMRNHNGERSGPARSLYLGDPLATHVLLDNDLWPIDGKMPCEPSGKSGYGAPEYREDTGEFKCAECGEWSTFLARHVRLHKQVYPRFRDYKITHGINLTSGLVSPRIKAAMSAAVNLRTEESTNRQRASFAAARSVGVANGNKAKRLICQTRRQQGRALTHSPGTANLRDNCRAQSMRDGLNLFNRLGYPPTLKEMDGFVNSKKMHSLERKRIYKLFGSVAGFYAAAGIPAPKSRIRNAEAAARSRRIASDMGKRNWIGVPFEERQRKMAAIRSTRPARTAQAGA